MVLVFRPTHSPSGEKTVVLSIPYDDNAPWRKWQMTPPDFCHTFWWNDSLFRWHIESSEHVSSTRAPISLPSQPTPKSIAARNAHRGGEVSHRCPAWRATLRRGRDAPKSGRRAARPAGIRRTSGPHGPGSLRGTTDRGHPIWAWTSKDRRVKRICEVKRSILVQRDLRAATQPG